jgi:hypothetical protein
MSPNLPLLSTIFLGILLAFATVAMVYSARMFLGRQSSPGPRKSRQIARIALGPTTVALAIILAVGQIRPDKRVLSYLVSAPLMVIVLRFAWEAFREPTESDAISCFAHDRERCGRCGYSVTGNVTGRCPECGWIYPVGEMRAEDPDWSAWWRKWRIGYLHKYLWHLSSYLGMGLYFLVLSLIFWMWGELPSAVLSALVGIHLCINGFRVIGYLRRAGVIQPTLQ